MTQNSPYAVAPRNPDVAPAHRPMVETHDVSRDYAMAGSVVHAVRDVSITVGRGQLIALRGRSGSGKTTFLSMIGGLDRPTRGTVTVDGLAVSELPESDLINSPAQAWLHLQGLGLLPFLSAAENVEIPLRLIGADPKERDERVRELLELVGLGGRANHRPHELSGGEQQRVAIAAPGQPAGGATRRRADGSAQFSYGPRDHGRAAGTRPQRRTHGNRGHP